MRNIHDSHIFSHGSNYPKYAVWEYLASNLPPPPSPPPAHMFKFDVILETIQYTSSKPISILNLATLTSLLPFAFAPWVLIFPDILSLGASFRNSHPWREENPQGEARAFPLFSPLLLFLSSSSSPSPRHDPFNSTRPVASVASPSPCRPRN